MRLFALLFVIYALAAFALVAPYLSLFHHLSTQIGGLR